MPLPVPKPSEDGIRDLYGHLYSQWNTANRVAEEFRALILQKNIVENLELDEEERNMTPVQVHSGRSGGIIEHARGLLMALPSFGVEPEEETTEEKRLAEQTERALARVFVQQLVANDFWPQVARDALAYGCAFVKALPLPSVWSIQAGYPVRGKREDGKAYLDRVRKWKKNEADFPFVIQYVPRFNVLPLVDGDDNVLASIETKRIMAGVLAELGSPKAKDAISSGACKWYEEMIVVEYMDEKHVAYFVSNNRVTEDGSFSDLTAASFELFRTWEHGLGKCPMVLIPGIKTGEVPLEDRYKSFLWDAKEMLETYDRLLSRLSTMVYAYYLPSYLWTIAQSSSTMLGKDRPVLKIKLGGTTVKYADEIVEPVPYPPGLPDADRLLTEADDIIQRHTLEDVLFGRVTGSAPAFQVNLRINVARSKLTPIAQHLAQGVTRIAELFLRGVIWFGEEVVIDGEEITPEMAKKALGRLRITIDPKSPVDRNSDIGTFVMATQQAQLPWDWAVEHILGEENPATLRLMKDIESLEQGEEVQARLLQDAMSRLDILEEEEEFEDANGIDMSMLPPGMQEAIAAKQGGGGLGRGPFPPGAAPQTIGGGRGLLTPKTQPDPPNAQVGTTAVM